VAFQNIMVMLMPLLLTKAVPVPLLLLLLLSGVCISRLPTHQSGKSASAILP
jgi:hypothetical protein